MFDSFEAAEMVSKSLREFARTTGKRGTFSETDLRKLNRAELDQSFGMFMLAKMVERMFTDETPMEKSFIYSSVFLIIHSSFEIGKIAAISADGKMQIDQTIKSARIELSRKGRQAQKAIHDDKRAKVEAAIRSMGTFAKSDAFAKRAAIVVLEKTGYDIPWQTIKSSYLLKMKPTQSTGVT